MSRKRKGNPMSASEAGKLARAASPWNRGPHCATGKAKASHIAYRRKGKAKVDA